MPNIVKKPYFNIFKGLGCIYKNSSQSNALVLDNFKLKLQQGAVAEQKKRPLRSLIRIHEENVGRQKPLISIEPDFTSHELVCGPPFELEDVNIIPVNPLSRFASGVQVIGVNDGELSKQLEECLMLRVYHVDAVFGRATRDGTVASKILCKTPWEKVTQARMEKLLNALQAEHQKSMFTYSGVPSLSSQEAYRLACSGLIRPPHANTPPIIYGIRCVSFDLPTFQLEIHAINETSQYLATLVHNIGARLKSSACCLRIRRIRQGPFTVDDALLDKHWTVENVAENIATCTEKGRNVVDNLSRDNLSQSKNLPQPSVESECVEKFTKDYNYKIS